MSGEDLFRPRDEWDADVHPESLRGKALALMDTMARTTAELDAAIAVLSWWRRWPIRVGLAVFRAWCRLQAQGRLGL